MNTEPIDIQELPIPELLQLNREVLQKHMYVSEGKPFALLSIGSYDCLLSKNDYQTQKPEFIKDMIPKNKLQPPTKNPTYQDFCALMPGNFCLIYAGNDVNRPDGQTLYQGSYIQFDNPVFQYLLHQPNTPKRTGQILEFPKSQRNTTAGDIGTLVRQHPA